MTTGRWLRVIAVWQMIGGAIAAVTFLDAVRTVPEHQTVAVALVLLGAAAAVGAALAGFGLFRGRPGALVPSLVAQGLQLVGFNLGTTVFQLTLGPYLYATILWGERASLQVGFMPKLLVRFGLEASGTGAVAINLLACWCFWRLLWAEPQDVHALAVTPAPPREVATPAPGLPDSDAAAT